MTFNLSNTFIESAVWADDIKNLGWNFWDNWHYIDRPYNPQGIFTPLEQYETSPWAINETLDVLTNFTSIGNITIEKSMMLRMMMHIIGDMHQPLHNAEFYSLDYINGDEGGNLINITYNGMPTELHAFWDSIAETLPTFSRVLMSIMLV